MKNKYERYCPECGCELDDISNPEHHIKRMWECHECKRKYSNPYIRLDRRNRQRLNGC